MKIVAIAYVTKLGKQTASLHLRRNVQPDGVQHGGHQIDERYRIGNRAGRSIFRQPDDQRHMHGGVVDEKAVRPFAVLSQTFAMVAAEHDDRVPIDSFLFQEAEKPPDLFIGKRDFSIVGLCRILATIRLGRTIRKMRIVEMHPKKKLLLRILRQPVQRHIGHHIARTLHLVEIRFVQTAEIEVVIIKIKSLIQSKARVQNRGGNHRPRLVPGLLEHRGQRGLQGTEFVAAEIVHAAQHRVGSRQHGRVRRQGHGNDREGTLKARSIRSQAVDVRRLDLLVSVAADMIGAQRVNRDQDHIQRRLPFAPPLAAR